MPYKIKRKTKYLFAILSTLLGIVFVNEWLFRLSPIATLEWLTQRPFLFLLNIATLVAITTLIAFLTKKVHFAIWFVLLIGLILGAANANKFSLRSIPLVFEDLFLLKEIWVLLPKLLNLQTLILVILAIPIVYFSYKLTKKCFGGVHWNDFKKPFTAAFLISALCLGAGQLAFTNDLDAWEVGFIYSLSNGTRKAPEVQPEIEHKASQLSQEPVEMPEPNALNQKPNVIVIMSESFWDVRKLGVSFSENPLDKWDQLIKESAYGNLYVPVFGGGTSNSEYEVITGMSLKAYPYDWYMVYREEITSPHPSLAYEYAKAGYKTIAVHPYYPWYYRRHEVYPLLGFSEFLSLDAFQQESSTEESEDEEIAFISDAEVLNKILGLIESESSPIMVHSVTMQNHGPYDDNRFPVGVEILTPLSDDAKTHITTYARGIQLSQNALYDFIQSLKQMEEPTLVLYFGDHLPMMGNNYSYYRETGYLNDDDEPQRLKDDLRMTTTPFLLWANYPIPTGEMPTQNASYMAPEVLLQSGISLSPYFKSVQQIREKAPLLLREYLVDGEGQLKNQYTEYYQEIKTLYQSLLPSPKKEAIP